VLAVFLAVPLALPGIGQTAAATGTPLYPNLKTLPPRELRFDRADITPELSGVFHNVLRFSNDTYNAGDGPLILNATIDPTTLRGPASQRVMNSDGTYTDIPLGTDMYWHAAHSHYHFDGWGGYELWAKATYDAWIASGRTTGQPLYTGAKTTSCVTDEEFVTSTPPNTVYPGQYDSNGCNLNAQNQLHMGLGVGWGDTYDWYRQLQWIDLGQDTLANGTYVLRAVADPQNYVYESANKADPVRESVTDNEATTTFVVTGSPSNPTIVDSDPPTGTLAINHVDATTTNEFVAAAVTARDDVSEPDQFRLSNDGNTWKTFSYTSSGSTPTVVSWDLTDPTAGGTSAGGLKTVYAQAHDNSGKWGPTFTDSITLTTGGGGGPPPPPPSGPYATAIIGDAPSGYWRLGESSGTTAYDGAGSDSGSYKNAPTLGTAGLLTNDANTAVTFNGTNQYVSIPSTGPLAPANAVTLEAWIKPASIPAAGTFRSVLTKADSYSLQFNGPLLEFTIVQGTTKARLQATSGAIVAGQKYHVVGTYDGTTQKLYINGSLVKQAPLTGAINTNLTDLTIGSWNAGEYFSGVIDEAAVYPVPLTSAQVLNHYNVGTSVSGTQATLAISRSGAGSGSVTSNPAAINCGATCSAGFPAGTSITLTASPSGGSTFGSWTGAAGCTTNPVCTFTLNATTNVNAAFDAPPSSALTVTKSGTGTGTVTSNPAGISCGATCSASIVNGSVTLTATSDAGTTFTSWTGASGCTTNPVCTFTLSTATTVTAAFNAAPPSTLTVTKSGSGTGTVTSTPAGISCGATCSASIVNGSVTLTATPTAGSTFTSWTGAAGCTTNPVCTFTLSVATTVTAAFTAVPSSTLTVTKSGSGTGTVTSTPAGISCGATCSASIVNGSVTLTATPDAGWVFTSWTGASGCTTNPVCTFTLSAAISVTATFGVAPASGYQQVVTADAPAGYWRLDETTGTTAAKAAGTANNGTYTNVTLGAAGLIASTSDKAASFSGSSSRVQIASSAAVSPTAQVSVEAWIKPTAIPASGSFASVTSKAESYSLQFNGPRLEFTIMQSGTRRRLQAPAGAIAVGGTYHVVGTYDGTTQRLYINGAQSVSAALTGAITANTNGLYIGSWNGSQEFFQGTIDEVAVYTTALTAAKVSNHYVTGTTVKTALIAKASPAQFISIAAPRSSTVSVGGATPVAIAFDTRLHRAYVTHTVGRGLTATKGVTIFDTRTWRVVRHIITGGTGPISIAVDPVRHLVYVTSAVYSPTRVEGRIRVLDGRTGRIVHTIVTGPGPKAIAVNPRSGRIYVTEQTGPAGGTAVGVFDGRSWRRLAMIPIGPYERYFENPFGLAVNAATNMVYATNPLDGDVYTIDGSRNEVVRSVGTGGSPTAVTVGSDGAVFVAGARDVVEIAPSGAVTRVPIGARTRGVAVDATSHVAYATTDRGDIVSIQGGASTKVMRGGKPWGIAVDPSTGTVVVANVFAGGIIVRGRPPQASLAPSSHRHSRRPAS
jgi:DNA-binding beta-propeller fold protein YncE